MSRTIHVTEAMKKATTPEDWAQVIADQCAYQDVPGIMKTEAANIVYYLMLKFNMDYMIARRKLELGTEPYWADDAGEA